MPRFLIRPIVALLLSAVLPQTPVAPDFTLKTAQGASKTLHDLRGKVVVLNFWATWCPPCRTEIPALMKLQAKYGSERLAVIGVAMDEEGAAVVAPFLQRERFLLEGEPAAMNYPALIGTDAVGNAYRVDGLPMTVVLDPNGREVRRIESAVAFDEVDRLVQSLTGQPPAVGAKAPDFTLQSLDGATVRLSDEVAHGPVVLVVLRGFPTYQCPFCTRQFADYLAHGDDLTKTGAHVLFVYPGPAEGLNDHAKALIAGRPIPASYQILMDPDYAFTVAYNLRWDAPKETAYPSTFVIDRTGIVTFGRTSRVHADRVTTDEVLKALAALPRSGRVAHERVDR